MRNYSSIGRLDLILVVKDGKNYFLVYIVLIEDDRVIVVKKEYGREEKY